MPRLFSGKCPDLVRVSLIVPPTPVQKVVKTNAIETSKTKNQCEPQQWWLIKTTHEPGSCCALKYINYNNDFLPIIEGLQTHLCVVGADSI